MEAYILHNFVNSLKCHIITTYQCKETCTHFTIKNNVAFVELLIFTNFKCRNVYLYPEVNDVVNVNDMYRIAIITMTFSKLHKLLPRSIQSIYAHQRSPRQT